MRRPGEVEAVGRRLGGGALVGQHAAGALVDDLERRRSRRRARALAPVASMKRMRYSVNVGARRRPACRRRSSRRSVAGRALVAVGAVALARDVDVDDVVLGRGRQRVEVGVRQHVVRRGDDVVERQRGVAEGGERFEPRHANRLAAPGCYDGRVPTPDDRRIVVDWPASASCCATSTASCGWPARAIPGSVEADRPTRARRVAGSCSSPTTPRSLIADQEQALAAIGIAGDGDVATVGAGGGAPVEPGETVLVCGGPASPRRSRAARCQARRDDDGVDAGRRRRRLPSRLRLRAAADRHAGRARRRPSAWRPTTTPTYPTPRGADPRRRERSSPRSPRRRAPSPRSPASRTRRWRRWCATAAVRSSTARRR